MLDLRDRVANNLAERLNWEADSFGLRLRVFHVSVNEQWIIEYPAVNQGYDSVTGQTRSCGRPFCVGNLLSAVAHDPGLLVELRTLCVRPGQQNVVRSRLHGPSRGLFGSERPLGTGCEAEVFEVRPYDRLATVCTGRAFYQGGREMESEFFFVRGEAPKTVDDRQRSDAPVMRAPPGVMYQCANAYTCSRGIRPDGTQWHRYFRCNHATPHKRSSGCTSNWRWARQGRNAISGWVNNQRFDRYAIQRQQQEEWREARRREGARTLRRPLLEVNTNTLMDTPPSISENGILVSGPIEQRSGAVCNCIALLDGIKYPKNWGKPKKQKPPRLVKRVGYVICPAAIDSCVGRCSHAQAHRQNKFCADQIVNGETLIQCVSCDKNGNRRQSRSLVFGGYDLECHRR